MHASPWMVANNIVVHYANEEDSACNVCCERLPTKLKKMVETKSGD